MTAPLEGSALFLRLIVTLEEHGAGRPQGFQATHEELAELAGFTGKRALGRYLSKAKAHGLVTATPQAYRNREGLVVRGGDLYHLRITSEKWLARREAVVDKLVKETRARASVKSRNAQRERSRLVRQARERNARAAQAQHAPEPVPIDTASVAARVAAMGDDVDLAGW